jgi:tripartite-type tricarboxylate transporter receptor subunit TctC
VTLTRRSFALAPVGLAFAACSRERAPYPSREVKLIVQAAPGGISDSVSRIMASLVEKELGVPVVCENRPGAAGALAFSYVVRRPPDGYTIGHGPAEIAMVRTLGYADVGPDQMDLICMVSKTQPALAVHADAPWRTLRDFLDAATARPGYYVLGNSGTGSIWHVNALLLQQATRIRVIHCPFGGSSGSITSLLGRHIDAVVAGVGEVGPHVSAGRLKVLSVFDQTRSALFPDVPSLKEDGFEAGASTWGGFYGPKGMDEAVRRRLAAAFRVGFDSPEYQKLCEERGNTAVFLDSAEFHDFAVSQAQFFTDTLPGLMRGTA